MKKTYIFSALLLAAALIPASASAQSLFNFKASNKTQVSAPVQPAVQTTATAEVSAEDDITLSDIQNQPLHVRRQIVAAELEDIRLRLSILSDKTRTAAERLAENGISTDAALTSTSESTLILAQTKLSIDTLALAANDPKNETVTDLKVDGVAFKDAVISVETMLRDSRQAIIDALAALKLAVSASVSAQ